MTITDEMVERARKENPMFKVGEKVICVDDSPVRSDCATVMPLKLTKNAIYIVRSIHTEPELPGYGVRLDELENPSVIWSDGSEVEWSYASHRFRPLIRAALEAALSGAKDE